MADSHRMLITHPEISALVHQRALTYPIESKEHFILQMVEAHQPICFRGKAYEAEFAAKLMPEFFFPVASEQDMIEKATELVISRGLLPLPNHS